ncbi:MAG TPA: hypothetical protein VHB47_13345 [Thermoanaerobaculia bacterium]|jgi:hypothetical protein|nr:hypothetical protein [Thermoanaerobaculia bacterium]
MHVPRPASRLAAPHPARPDESSERDPDRALAEPASANDLQRRGTTA